MTTFLFMLAPDSSAAEIARVRDELSNRFPQHLFIGDSDDFPGGAFDIMALGKPAQSERPARSPEPEELDRVKHAFFAMLDNWG